MEYIPTNLSSLCDGNWHSIRADKNRVTASLVVDGQSPVTTTLPSTGFISVNTESPLYAGGVPSKWFDKGLNIFLSSVDDILLRYTVTSTSFQGCLNNVQLVDSNQGREIITDVYFSDVFVSPSVQLNTCHL